MWIPPKDSCYRAFDFTDCIEFIEGRFRMVCRRDGTGDDEG